MAVLHNILMADIIKSRKKNQQQVKKQFAELIAHVNKPYKNQLLSPLTITLGDEFQGVAKTIHSAIDIIQYLEELIVIKNIDWKLRYVLLQGKIETEINPKIAYGMMGKGLAEARQQLISLKKTGNRFHIFLSNKTKMHKLNSLFIIYQMIVDDWGNKDYSLIKDFVELIDYKKVAEANKKTYSQMWKRERSLHLKEYKIIKNLIKEESL
ncbi:MAG: hypothetical protein HYR66_04805 [Sphingobacteriales bacterium]|nr:hypothetical protein [Sphingobacteriales bacterium]MBI3719166.1 hypothetical protein [Sphingobacteriales bacterium]